MMERLTCLTCHVSLSSSGTQREHFKSEWHLYNLKRRLSQLNSITEDEFQKIKLKHSEQINDLSKPVENSYLYCSVCGKNFIKPKVFQQHLSSNKHIRQLNIAKKLENKFQNISKNQKTNKQTKPIIEEDTEKFNESDWEEVDSDEEELETIPINECLFCGEPSKDVESNLSHMSTIHSFFIPDIEYCSDIEGLLKYLGIKIASGRCCLWCSDHGKQFATKKSAQQHMIDVGHTKVNFHNRAESLLEFEDFYDYSSSYPEDISDDMEEEMPILKDNDYQLKLPSGAVIGHRALLIYYKQKLKPDASNDKKKNKELMNKVTSRYKSLGWTGLTGSLAVQYARDVHYMNNLFQKFNLKIGQRHNITKQSHFRCQTEFK